MSKFQVGDTVRFVVAGQLEPESADWAADEGLRIGQLYRVESVAHDKHTGAGDQAVRLHETAHSSGKYWVCDDHFQLASDPWGAAVEKRAMTLPTDSAERKEFPLFRGVLRYFPAALAGVAQISKKGNDKHNPGEPMHHARGKSMDHGDCVIRHMVDVEDLRAALDRGDYIGASPEKILEEVDQMVWRALAFSQELHEKFGSPVAPGAKVDTSGVSSPLWPKLEKPLAIGDKVWVSDRYLFCIDVKAEVIRTTERHVEVRLLQSGGAPYPVGFTAWFGRKQVRPCMFDK